MIKIVVQTNCSEKNDSDLIIASPIKSVARAGFCHSEGGHGPTEEPPT